MGGLSKIKECDSKVSVIQKNIRIPFGVCRAEFLWYNKHKIWKKTVV